LRECPWLGFVGSKILDRYYVSSSMTLVTPFVVRVMVSKAVILNLIQNLRECPWSGSVGSKILDRYWIDTEYLPV
ncbi:hypothetical protein, partial [Vibrio breoganii]|uniref:hypothetical protein n=1 Tax=Vibrio breoganii TaxID=553239 RepID=UPI0018E46084